MEFDKLKKLVDSSFQKRYNQRIIDWGYYMTNGLSNETNPTMNVLLLGRGNSGFSDDEKSAVRNLFSKQYDFNASHLNANYSFPINITFDPKFID